MESEERTAPVQEAAAAEAESAAAREPAQEPPAAAAGAESAAPAEQQALPGTPLAQFALEQQLARGCLLYTSPSPRD